MASRLRERPSVWLVVGLAFHLGWVLLVLSQFVCLRAWVAHGVAVPDCPRGSPRQTVWLEAQGLRRGSEGYVRVKALAHYTTGAADEHLTTECRRFAAEISLHDAQGRDVPLTQMDSWEKSWGHARQVGLRLPEVPDGDYRLRARVSSPLGTDEQELSLPLYAPARIHVITDRPLYEPGNTVRFRAVVLRAKDLAPLDGRPGSWMVLDPAGEVLLEERAPAGPWGVVAGSFPLDAGAPTGSWKVRWVSDRAADEVGFQVEPFTLPRFRVEAAAGQPFYRPGDRPELSGSVRYSSGAPVAGARLELQWSVSGEWPPPSEWLEQGKDSLPRLAGTGSDGRFSLQLPRVPGDLQGRATLRASLAATDPAGDRVEGGAQLLLSRDALQVETVTELADGLVQGFNNRLYLRVAAADGRILPGHEIRVRRAWEPSDEGVAARTDEDGVAAVQIDPGPPVNVVIPPQPVRPPPRLPAVRRTGVRDLLGGQEEPLLADQVALDGWMARLEPCARFVEDEAASVELGLRVSPAGRIVAAAAAATALARCLKQALAPLLLPAGEERLYLVEISVNSPDLPRLQPRLAGSPQLPDELQAALSGPVLDARGCLPETIGGGWLPRALQWQQRKGSKELQLAWLHDGRAVAEAVALDAAALRCVEQRLAGWRLAEEAEEEAIGVLRLRVEPAPRVRQARPQAMTMLGYELAIACFADGRELGSTRVRLRPGTVPPLRLRATPVLARPGEEVLVELIRGPGFGEGMLPEHLYLNLEDGSTLKEKLEEQTRKTRFSLPQSARGWATVQWGGAAAYIYVRSGADLSLELKPGQERYAPGQVAELLLWTRQGEQGQPAAVGLFGVDESLAQLVALPGPDDMARLRPKPEVSAPAFGVLDGQALVMGRVRGANAAAATILRVSSIPSLPELDVSVYASEQGRFDPVEELTDRFYVLLAEHYAQVRRWEEQAPRGELMHPATMARLWDQALVACQQRKERVEDAYGGRLRLSSLPEDLLALAGPRAAVIEGTRLPEDVEDWTGWVRRNEP